MSTFGRLFRVTTFGESHCPAVGCVIDGCPPLLPLTEADIQPQLTRRRPGQSRLTTARNEVDRVRILSGTEAGVTLGTPIALLVPNEDAKPGDYAGVATIPRPGHADYTYMMKYGTHSSSGGGRSSARETVARVAAGAVAEKWLFQEFGTRISCFVSAVGHVVVPPECTSQPGGGSWSRVEVDLLGTLKIVRRRALCTGHLGSWVLRADSRGEEEFCEEALKGSANPSNPCYADLSGLWYTAQGVVVCPGTHGCDIGDFVATEEAVHVRCPHTPTACKMATLIRRVKLEQDSVGGVLTCVCDGLPVGWGEPVFDKLPALLAHAMMSIPATKGFEVGSGFAGTAMRGSVHNDVFVKSDTPGQLSTSTNHCGGALGGISSGGKLVFRVAIKPVSTIGKAQATCKYSGEPATLEAKGRHDSCVLPRAPPIVEAMAALVLADLALIQRSRTPAACAPPIRVMEGVASGCANAGYSDGFGACSGAGAGAFTGVGAAAGTGASASASAGAGAGAGAGTSTGVGAAAGVAGGAGAGGAGAGAGSGAGASAGCASVAGLRSGSDVVCATEPSVVYPSASVEAGDSDTNSAEQEGFVTRKRARNAASQGPQPTHCDVVAPAASAVAACTGAGHTGNCDSQAWCDAAAGGSTTVTVPVRAASTVGSVAVAPEFTPCVYPSLF